MLLDLIKYLFAPSLFVIVYLAIKYPNRCVGEEARPDLKGPKGLPIIGNLFLVLGNKEKLHDLLYKMTQEYGPSW